MRHMSVLKFAADSPTPADESLTTQAFVSVYFPEAPMNASKAFARGTGLIIIFLLLSFFSSASRPVLSAEPPLKDLYMRLIVAGVGQALENQSDDGRYNSSAAMKNRPPHLLQRFTGYHLPGGSTGSTSVACRILLWPLADHRVMNFSGPNSGSRRLLPILSCTLLLNEASQMPVIPLTSHTSVRLDAVS